MLMDVDTLLCVASELGLVITTQRQGDHAFRCHILEIDLGQKEQDSFRLIADGFEAGTCLEAQTHAYHYAQRLYPARADQMKKPPYLIWGGPSIHL